MYVIILVLFFLSIYKYCKTAFDDWRHELQCHGYLLLLITSYIIVYIIYMLCIRLYEKLKKTDL